MVKKKDLIIQKKLKKMSKSKSQAIIGTCERTLKQIYFSSALEAKEKGFHNVNISWAIKHNKPYKGYIWKKAR